MNRRRVCFAAKLPAVSSPSSAGKTNTTLFRVYFVKEEFILT
jgi:hypothetical protein